MRKPKGLKFGDTLGVIAPASPTTREKVGKSYKKLMNLGFKVKMGKSCYEKCGYLAGSDSLRAEDINQMFKDEEIDGIICLRGGYGTSRILDLLDYELIRNNPKIFIGYSDITALHIAISKISKIVTFHGPMVSSDIIDNFSDFSKENLYNFILKDRFNLGIIKNPIGEEIEIINGGVAEGLIIGGNLSLIVNTLGTPYEIELKDKILFIEEIGEEPYEIDRMFTQLRLSGKLREAEGIILGDFNNCIAKNSGYGNSLTLEQVIEDIIKPIGIPTIYNLKAGHCEPMVTLPFGVLARLNADKKKLTILESPIIL
ncbi:MAG: LD-carboxypeptidase [Tissierellia bacterium]|nr:LD-carboxypeptidase [Tissierellia bacterium]